MTGPTEYTMREMPYWLYKAGYSEFQATEYNPNTKTIVVNLPKMEPVRWPKGWTRNGNGYFTPGGTEIRYWNTGLARNYLIQRVIGPYHKLSKTVGPGFNAFSRVLDTVRGFEME